MLKLLKKSIRAGYPNRTGVQFLRVILVYVWLSALSILRWRKNYPPKLENPSQIWSQYSNWLMFQVTYIKPKYWARTPLIRDVTLVQTNPVSIETAKRIDMDSKEHIQEIALGFNDAFTGLDVSHYYNWLSRYFLMLNCFQEIGFSLFDSKLDIAEIGPGLAPVTALLSHPNRRIHSFDTFEMQEVAKFVEEKVIQTNFKVIYHPMNLVGAESASLLDEPNYCVVAFYSFTELNISDRARYLELIDKAEYTLIASNEFFEGINNFEFIEMLAKRLRKNFVRIQFENIFGPEIPNYVKKHRIYLISNEAFSLSPSSKLIASNYE